MTESHPETCPMTTVDAGQFASTMAGKQMRAAVILFLALVGGSGVTWFKADSLGVSLADVARTSEKNAFVLDSLREDLNNIINSQAVATDRYIHLSERVTILEVTLRELKPWSEKSKETK